MKKIIVHILIVVLLTNCAKEKPQEKAIKKVHSYRVSGSTLPNAIDALGHITSINSVEIKAQVEGMLIDSHFIEGTLVNEGDLLFTIDPRQYIAARDKAAANIQDNEAKLGYAKDSVERYQHLTKDNYISQLDFKQLKSEMESTMAMIEQNIADLELALINLNYCQIKAPFPGITGKKLLTKGNLITNNGEPLLTIKQIAPIYIDFSVSEKHLLEISQKHKEKPLSVEIYPKDNQSSPIYAQLHMINNKVDEKTGMIALRAICENTEQLLWPGQFVKSRLILNEINNAFIVPNECIALGQKGHYVFIIREDQTVSYQQVELGLSINGIKTQITKGLKDGDRIVSEGLIQIRSGEKVEIIRDAS